MSKPEQVELVSDENSFSLEKTRKTNIFRCDLEKCGKFNETIF